VPLGVGQPGPGTGVVRGLVVVCVGAGGD
jgi:hypothetical protein